MKAVLLPSVLTLMIAPAAMADQLGVVEYGQGDISTVPVPTFGLESNNYVDVGAYEGGTVETIDAVPYAAPGVIETAPVFVDPAPVYTEPVYTEPVYAAPDYTVADVAMPALDTGATDQDYESDRLAAFDTDGDGTVSTREAIASLAPLRAPAALQ